MVWEYFSKLGKPSFFFTIDPLNSAKYISILENALFPYADGAFGEKYTFQHDNDCIHRSNATKAFLKNKKVEILDWSAHFPDLNPKENLCGELVRIVYNNRKALFNTVTQMKKLQQNEQRYYSSSAST